MAEPLVMISTLLRVGLFMSNLQDAPSEPSIDLCLNRTSLPHYDEAYPDRDIDAMKASFFTFPFPMVKKCKTKRRDVPDSGLIGSEGIECHEYRSQNVL
jgi:hypothetical protein